MENVEYRHFTTEIRTSNEDKKRTVSGRAIPFNIFSPNREGFRERIAPSAVEGIIEASDIFMLYNHDKTQGFLARKNKKGKGCLRIDVKDDGVYFEFEAKNDNISNYVYERLADGELDETSFAFTVAEEEWKKCDDGSYERTITKFGGLYDFSIVDHSYYGLENAVGCKRFAELQEEDRIAFEKAKQEIEQREAEEAEAKEQERLANYYAELKKEYMEYLKADK